MAQDELRRIDRAHALLEGLSSDSERRRRLTISWARYLDQVKQLPAASAALLIEVAASDDSQPVAHAAAGVAAEAASGSAVLREVARDRLKGGGATNDVPQLASVLGAERSSSEGMVTVPPCRASTFGVFGPGNCNRNSATRVEVCSGLFPKGASVLSTRVFTKWSGDPRPWGDAQAALNADGEWNAFGGAEVRQRGQEQQVCVPFLQWSSHQARDARIEVTYTRQTVAPS